MKKLSLILTIVIVLALMMTACNISINPSTAPQVPQPGQPQPEQPQPGQPQPGQPQPGQPQPGQPQPGQPQPGQPEPGQPQPGQPEPGQPPVSPTDSGSGCAGAPVIPFFNANPTSITAGQSSSLSWGNITNGNTGPMVRSATIEPGLGEVGSGASSRTVSPTKTTTYTLTGTGCGGTTTQQVTVTVGSQPAPTATMAAIPAQPRNLDLTVSNIYPSSTGHIMVTLKNAGNVNISGSYKLVCSGSYTDSGGNHALSLAGQYANVNLTPGQTADFDTSYSRNPSIIEMWVSCKVTPPQGDTNSSNDSMGMTKVK